MRKPPPDQKGLADVNLIVESLPDRGRSSWHLGAVWALSQYQENEVWRGYCDQTSFAYMHTCSDPHTHLCTKGVV